MWHGKRAVTALLLAAAVAAAAPLTALAQQDGDGDELSGIGAQLEESGTEDEAPSGEDGASLFDALGEDGEEDIRVEEEPVPQARRPVASTGPGSDIINGAALNPRDPASPALDAVVEEILDSILTDDMDTYAKLRACYDYLVDTVSYGSHQSKLSTPVGSGVTCGDIYSAYGEVEGYAAVAFTARTGMCNVYASGFIVMARKLGLDADLVKGSTKSGGGGYAYHEWAEITVNGQVYLFDPQLEQDLVNAGLAPYTVFCRTYDQVPGRYSK